MRTNADIQKDISNLTRKRMDIHAQAVQENRAPNKKEADLIREIDAEIASLREQMPLTLENSHDHSGRDTRTDSGRDYRSLFGLSRNQTLDTGGFQDAAEFLRVLESGRYDPRLQARASMGVVTPSLGGFAAPDGFAAEWLDDSLPNEIVRPICKNYGMTEGNLMIPGFDSSDMSAGKAFGGIGLEFLSEGSDATPQTAKLRRIELQAKMGAIYVNASLELVQDGKGFADNLQGALVKSIGYGIDRYCISGMGGGEPLGLIHSACKVQVPIEAGQKADTICYANIKKMFGRALNPENSVWLFNNSAIPELLEISIGVGTGGVYVPLLNESSGEFRIFGRPVYFSPHMPALGDADDCLLFDPNFYALGIRSDVVVDISDVPRWTQRERSFRVLLRFDGQCVLDRPVTPEHGSTLSSVVTLATRP